jgi:hypothetical protein
LTVRLIYGLKLNRLLYIKPDAGLGTQYVSQISQTIEFMVHNVGIRVICSILIGMQIYCTSLLEEAPHYLKKSDTFVLAVGGES